MLLGTVVFTMTAPIDTRAATTLTTGAEVNINNISSDIDYKLTKDELENTHDTVLSYTDLKEVDRDESDLFMTTDFLRNVSDLEYYSKDTRDAKTWLIENNIYSRPVEVNLNAAKVKRIDTAVKQDYDNASKSDFLMMLYKAECGVIPSNIVNVGNLTLKREHSGSTGLGNVETGGVSSIADYWDDGVNASFGEDSVNYISPNVYELYLEQMLNSGIVSYSDLGGDYGFKLREDLFEDGKPKKSATGAWRKNSINYFKGGVESLGYANTVKNGVVTEGLGEYFLDESMTTLEAIHYVAEFMRKYENISNTEADMIAYKYGLSEFATVPQEYLTDVYYLVGAGIISFDGSGPKYFLSDEKSNLLTQGEMFDLIYRVANKGARYTFKTIQLSDAESTLKDMGFLKNDYTYITPTALPLEMSNDFNNSIATRKSSTVKFRENSFVKLVKEGEKNTQPLQTIANFLFPTTVLNAATEAKTYEVTKQFDYKYKDKLTGNKYKYYSTLTGKYYTISDDTAEGCLGNAEAQKELATEFKSIKTEDVGKYSVYTVTFTVKAHTYAAAAKKVNQRLMHTAYSNSTHYIDALTKVEIDGQQVTMISQEALKGIDDIVILHDRVLMNTKTKAKCLIQSSLTKTSTITTNTQYGYAIVGSQILSGEPIMIEGSDDSVYYNIKCVLALLPNSSYATLNFGSATKVNNTLLGISLHHELTSKYTYGMLNQDESEFTYIRLKNKSELTTSDGDATTVMYNMTNLYKGMTSLSRTFYIDFGGTNGPEKVTFIVDLAYCAPEEAEIEWDPDEDDAVHTFDEYQVQLTTAPSKEDNPAMYHYWQRNYGMSNALCNMLYGTKDKVYVKSGYFVPKLAVLLPKSFALKDSKANITYDNIFSKQSDDVKALQDSKQYKALNQFMAENLYVAEEYSTYLPVSEAGNATIDAWWTTYFPGKAGIKKQFTTLLGDKDLAAAVAEIYSSLSATTVEVAVADGDTNGATLFSKTTSAHEANTTTNTSIGGTTTTASSNKTNSVPYAVLTDCNILYRNTAYPKTLSQSGGGGSVLSVSYVNKRSRVISNVTVQLQTKKKSASKKTGDCTVRFLSTLYKGSGTMQKYTAYRCESGSKYYTLTPVFSPALLAGKTANAAYLGKGVDLCPLQDSGFKAALYVSKGKPKITMFYKAMIQTKTDAEKVASDIDLIRTTNVIPSASKMTHKPSGAYGKWVKNTFLAKCPLSDTELKEIGGEVYTLPVATLKRYAGKNATRATFGYVYSDRVLIAVYEWDNSSSYANTTVDTTKLGMSDLYVEKKNGYVLNQAYEDVYFFNCYKYKVLKSNYYIDSTPSANIGNYLPKKDVLKNGYHLHKNLPDEVSMIQNFYHTALNDQVIKATIASKMKLVDVDDLPEGARLNIGETVWIKRGEYWESYPINVAKSTNTKWKRALKKGKFSKASCYKVLCSIWSGYSVGMDGNYLLLHNYVDSDSVDIGTGYRGSIPTSVNGYVKSGLLAKPEGESDTVVYKYSKKNDTITQKKSGEYKYVTLKFKFQTDKGLKAMAVNATNTAYDFMFDADGYGSGMDLAIFTDDLDMEYDSEVQVTVSTKDTSMDNVLKITNKEFKSEFLKTTAIDWYRWVRYATLIATCWLFFMLWFAYIILQRGIAFKFFEALAKPGFRKQGKGLDVIKLFTFGILNVDSQPTLNQMAGMTVLLIMIDVIVGYVL